MIQVSHFRRLIVSPFGSVLSPHDRSRAEILVWLALLRWIFVSGHTIYYKLHGFEEIEGLYLSTLLSGIFYFIARTKYYKISAFLSAIEPMIIIPIFPLRFATTAPLGQGLEDLLSSVIFTPGWLTLGPIIGCLVLPIRSALMIIAMTVACFAVIFYRVDPFYYKVIGLEFAYTMAVSCVAFVGAVLRDRADQELELERAKVHQSAKFASLGEMASGMAHELNSPLCAIVLNIEFAQEFLKNPQISPELLKNRLNEISQISYRMGKIIQGLKSFSRDAAGEDIRAISAGQWIQDALNLCQERFTNAGIRIELLQTDALSRQIQARPVQMVQALLNVLNNAFDATRNHSQKWLRIEAVVGSHELELTIVDSGAGVPSQNVDKIFQPFFTTKDYGHGTGLGLSVSRGIVQNLGGDLIYDSQSVHTRFVFRVPLSKQDAL